MSTISSFRKNEVLLDVRNEGRAVVLVFSTATLKLTENEANIMVDKVVDALEARKK